MIEVIGASHPAYPNFSHNTAPVHVNCHQQLAGHAFRSPRKLITRRLGTCITLKLLYLVSLTIPNLGVSCEDVGMGSQHEP